MTKNPAMTVKVVSLSVAHDETPEGLFRADRMRRRAEAERRRTPEAVLAMADEVERRVAHAVLFGDAA